MPFQTDKRLLKRIYLIVVALFALCLIGFRGTATPTPTPTPIHPDTPTQLPPRDLDLLPTFEALMVENSDCVLPCWWGFTPDETTTDEIVNLFERTGFDRYWRLSTTPFALDEYVRRGEPFILNFRNAYDFRISFAVNNANILRTTHLVFYDPIEWLPENGHWIQLPSLLEMIDEEPEVYIPRNVSASDYAIFLVYRERRIVIIYNFDLSLDNPTGPTTQVCLDLQRTRSISMELNDLESGFLNPQNSAEETLISDFYTAPEVFLGVDTETFINFFRGNPQDCLEGL